MKILGDLFLTFMQVGGLTFGGGYAMLPILQREVVEKRNWATDEELTDYFAVGQCTPGIIAVNTATFVGQKQAGVLGGIVATLGIVAPSLVIISILAGFINTFAELAVIKNAFAGIRVCVCVLIFNAVCKLWKSSVKNKLALAIFAVVTLGSLFFDLSPVFFVVVAAVLGIALEQFAPAARKDKKEGEV
ncbi:MULTISPECIES: chromate transporter [Eubacteriales]|uniref:chromate transporter n=1 Tax=Eubacteriales TaxID=186802 RepID=UPI000B36FF46|nr:MULTISPECIES: chromate transporter [Eubacteriales]MDY4167179.1 chromate transporter [Fournierella sp.]OUP25110.1 chromate transporter [Gemmiger sp. An194]